jgi:hypothetical protein
MADPEPTKPDQAATPPPKPASGGTTSSQFASAAGAAGDAVGDAVGDAAAAMSARWAVLGANERLALIGAILAIGSYIIGILLGGWSLGLTSILFLVAAVGVAVILFLGAAALTGQARVVVLRIAAATALAYSALDIASLIGALGGRLDMLDVVLEIAAFVGSALMVFAAWRLTGGNAISDATGLIGVISRPMPDRLVALGAWVVILALVILRIGGGRFSDREALAVLAVILVLTVLWIAGGGAGKVGLILPANVWLAIFGVVVAVLAVLYLVNIGDLRQAELLFWPGLLLYLGGAGALAAGAILRFQAPKA